MSKSYSNEENKRLVRRLYEPSTDTSDPDVVSALFSADLIASPGELDLAGYLQATAALHRGFPDVEFVIEDLFGEGDRVAVRWTFQGTHSGDFAGTKASGVRVTQTGNVIYQLRDGKVCRVWLQVDRLGLLQQVGGIARAAP
jgi:predicted ester cyclase